MDWKSLQKKCESYWLNHQRHLADWKDDFASYSIIYFLEHGHVKDLKYLAIDFGRSYNLFGTSARSVDACNRLNTDVVSEDIPYNNQKEIKKTDKIYLILDCLKLDEGTKNWIKHTRKNWCRYKTHAPYYTKKKLQKAISFT